MIIAILCMLCGLTCFLVAVTMQEKAKAVIVGLNAAIVFGLGVFIYVVNRFGG